LRRGGDFRSAIAFAAQILALLQSGRPQSSDVAVAILAAHQRAGPFDPFSRPLRLKLERLKAG
jgi:hypothetical protein